MRLEVLLTALSTIASIVGIIYALRRDKHWLIVLIFLLAGASFVYFGFALGSLGRDRIPNQINDLQKTLDERNSEASVLRAKLTADERSINDLRDQIATLKGNMASVPSHAENAPLPRPQDPYRIRKSNIDFQVTESGFSGSELTIWLEVVNHNADKDICLFWDSSAIDSEGNPQRKSEFWIGQKRAGGFDCTWVHLPYEVPVKVGVSFNAIKPTTAELALLELRIQGEGTLQFRRLPIPYHRA